MAARPRTQARPPFTRLLAALSAVLTAVTVAVVAGSAGPAAADSLADVQRQVAQAQAQLDALDRRAEQIAERYNRARIDLASAQGRYASAEQRVARADGQVAQLQKTIGAFAAAAYRSHGLAGLAAVTDSSPQDFLDRASSLDQIARTQQQTLDDLHTARHVQQDAREAANRALSAQQDLTAQITADRTAIRSAVSQQQSLLQSLRTKLAALQAAARRAAAAKAAREAAARVAALAAREAALNRAVTSLDSQPEAGGSAPTGGSGGARVAVQWAYRELGKPYQWGAEGPDSFDCSGLTKYVWGKAGVYLDHYTGAQWNEGRHVSRSRMVPGDLVFFHSDLHHMGIYVGNNQFIQAPRTGEVVQVSSLTGYWAQEFAGAVRPQG